ELGGRRAEPGVVAVEHRQRVGVAVHLEQDVVLLEEELAQPGRIVAEAAGEDALGAADEVEGAGVVPFLVVVHQRHRPRADERIGRLPEDRLGLVARLDVLLRLDEAEERPLVGGGRVLDRVRRARRRGGEKDQQARGASGHRAPSVARDSASSGWRTASPITASAPLTPGASSRRWPNTGPPP